MLILGMLAMIAGAEQGAADPVRDQMIDLYENICINAFPKDKDVDAAMAQLGATPMTRDEVSIFLHDDPGRGWRVTSGETVFNVTVEAPPYHACAVRVNLDREFADLGRYSELTDAYEKAHGEFFRMPPIEMDIGSDVHSRAVALQRVTPSGQGDSLFYFVNSPTAAAAANGAKGVEIRFVHQMATH
jgi:hypothetical protein